MPYLLLPGVREESRLSQEDEVQIAVPGYQPFFTMKAPRR